MMLNAGEHAGWVARQVGHSSSKMMYDHYYSYITNDQSDDGAKFMQRVYEKTQKKPRENESHDNSVTVNQNLFDITK